MRRRKESLPASGEVPKRELGRSGQAVSILGLGGSHIGDPEVADGQAIKIIHSAIDHGITFMDNSWDYHGGRSERLLGRALRKGYREKAFVMTKVDGRTAVEASKQLHQSLRRLETDRIDLLQHHEVIRFDDVGRIFAPGGAMEAFIAAQKAGKIRFIGFTGHKDPRIHLYMLEKARLNRFRFDAVQMPLNPMDAHFRSFESLVLPHLVLEGIAVLGMKSMGSGVLLKSRVLTARECLRYALTLPTATVITGIDSMDVLRQAVGVARGFVPLSNRQMDRIREKTAKAAGSGEFELFKTTSHFDATARHPEWLGGETPLVRSLAHADARLP